MNSEEKNNI